MTLHPKIVADQDIPYLKGILEPFAHVEYFKGSKIQRKHLLDAEVLIIRTRTICDKNLLDGTNIKLICSATIGMDHIDKNYCDQQGIQYNNAPGCNSGSVMQYVVSALVSLSIKYNFDLSKKTIGIIGYGNVGSKVAALASALGMKVLVNDPPLQRSGFDFDFVSLEKIQKEADILSFHVPLNREGIDNTFHMVCSKFFKSLSPQCFIINSSRGEVMDNKALKEALLNKQIKGAVLDVWENEPDIDIELLQSVDFGTAHIAGYSVEGKANGTASCIRTISKYFKIDLPEYYPQNLPEPQGSDIYIDNTNYADVEIIKNLILNSYNILSDHVCLLQEPVNFEELRSNYKPRREFNFYHPILKFENKNLEYIIHSLGFQ